MIRHLLLTGILALQASPGISESTGQLPQVLKVGLDICIRNAHSVDQYESRLGQLRAERVSHDKRILFDAKEEGKEWIVNIEGVSYITAFAFPGSHCAVLAPADFDLIQNAITGPPLRFTYNHTNRDVPGGQHVYKGNFEGEAIRILIARGSPYLSLGFSIDKMSEDFLNQVRGKK